jgi:hypothetical protein
MNPSSEAARSRANEVWASLVGLFGADTLKRKFGPTPPAEWVGTLAKLDARELERGMRRLVHSGRDQVPTLPAFLRLCRAVGDDTIADEPQALALPNPDAWHGDQWDMAANRHLQAHITRRIHADSRCYGAPASAHAMRKLAREHSPNADASPEFVVAVRQLVAAKNAWAADMRDLASAHPDGIVEPAIQRACWSDYLVSAERAIAARESKPA